LVYALIFHSLAGFAAGLTFRVQTLVLILACVAFEMLIVYCMRVSFFPAWIFINLAFVQIGYVGALFARARILGSNRRFPYSHRAS